jgi:hypothetical protein
MGYSVSIQARDKKLRDKAVKFFERVYRPWHAVWGTFTDHVYSSLPEANPSYQPDGLKNLIGIDYKSGLGGPERLYAYTLMQWLALKIGVEKEFPEVGTAPYLIYDCEDEGIPLLVQSLEDTPERLHESCVDVLGVPLKPYMDIFTDDFIDTKPLQSEMKRLDFLWDAES